MVSFCMRCVVWYRIAKRRGEAAPLVQDSATHDWQSSVVHGVAIALCTGMVAYMLNGM